MPTPNLRRANPADDAAQPAVQAKTDTSSWISLQNTFKINRYQLTLLDFPNYSERMEAELTALEEKVALAVQLCQHLRAENSQLRQELANALNDNKRMNEKISTAASRLESMLLVLPGDTA